MLNAGVVLFVDFCDGSLVLRPRSPLDVLLQKGAVPSGAVCDPDTGDWRVPFSSVDEVRGLCAEVRDVVVTAAAAPLVGVRVGDPVEGRLVPRDLWRRILPSSSDSEAAMLRSGGRCDGCGARGVSLDADVGFDDDLFVAEVVGWSVFCDRCGLLAHHGRSRLAELEDVAKAAAADVNGWDDTSRRDRWMADARLWADRSYDEAGDVVLWDLVVP